MCGLLQCGPAFDPNGLITGGYLFKWLQTVLNSPKEKVSFCANVCEKETLFDFVPNFCCVAVLSAPDIKQNVTVAGREKYFFGLEETAFSVSSV